MMISPTRNGFRMRIRIPLVKFCRVPDNARPAATPKAPINAANTVTSIVRICITARTSKTCNSSTSVPSIKGRSVGSTLLLSNIRLMDLRNNRISQKPMSRTTIASRNLGVKLRIQA
jgi:hypothetical protein